ncbi:MAG TPA: redoxin domain-containing protein [bacterium]|nr:redoxin domain-containing protein [bacterium]
MRLKYALPLALTLAATVTCGAAETEGEPMPGNPAPQIPAYGPDRWINSEPLTMEALRGRLVLVDFWEYTCVNCLRTLPYLKEWHRRYADLGLVILGVHDPEFEFGRERENVERAVEELGIGWPVLLDNDFELWRRYANNWWPRKILVNPEGVIIHDHIGEGGYGKIEEVIQEEITRLNPGVALPPIMEPVNPHDRPGAVCYPATPELYAGYARGRYGHPVEMDLEARYEPVTPHEVHRAYLEGDWRVEDGRLLHVSEADPPGDRVVIRCRATEVNAVLHREDGVPFRVYIVVDGGPVSETDAGADVKWDDGGRSFVEVDAGRMYRLLDAPTYADRELALYATGDGFGLYAFTFGACVESPDE